jgi:hypothetical protein
MTSVFDAAMAWMAIQKAEPFDDAASAEEWEAWLKFKAACLAAREVDRG